MPFAIAASCFFLAWICIAEERQSRRWYYDRVLLYTAGFFSGLGGVALSFGIYGLL